MRADQRTVDGFDPLIAGTHFVEAELDEMPAAIDALVHDESRRLEMANRARQMIFGELSLANSLGPLLDRIESDVLPNLANHSNSPSKFKDRLGPVQDSNANCGFRCIPAIPFDARHCQASGDGREHRAAATRRRGVPARPWDTTAHRAYRDAVVRRRYAGGECRGLAVQLRERRHRDVGQHRRERRHPVRSHRRRRPRHRRQPGGRREVHRPNILRYR